METTDSRPIYPGQEYDLGMNWTRRGDRYSEWRVTWVKPTGELIAVELSGERPQRFIRHPRLFATREEVDELLKDYREAPFVNCELESIFPLSCFS